MNISLNEEIKNPVSVLLNSEKINSICDILSSEKDISPEIRLQILSLIHLIKDMTFVATNQKKTAELLRQAMGFSPTKERDNKNTPQQTNIWSANVENKLHEKHKNAFNIWKEYKAKKPKKDKSKININTKDVEVDNSVNITQVSQAVRSPESIFQATTANIQQESKEVTVDRDISIPNNLIQPSSSWDKRIRYDVNLTITEIEYNVETVSCPITGFSKTAVVNDGPSGYRITYNGMAQLVLLVYGMGIPIVRLASSLGVSINYFNPSRIYRLCLHVARAFSAIYHILFENLALCDYLSGDDTFNSVLEMRNDEKPIIAEDFETALCISKKQPDPQKADFVLETKNLLGSQMPRKDGKGLKKSIFTTVVIGKKQDEQIVFYYTERKSFGDMLGKILAIRSNNTELRQKICTIQSDLSSANIPNPMPLDLPLVFLGCSAHSRRPFWRYRKDTNLEIGYYCYTMLLLFDKIADFDRDARESNSEQIILLSRQDEQKPLWNEILGYAKEIQDKFAPNSDFAKAADYIVGNFKTLTNYLTAYQAKPDNNQAERLLRYEKIMLDNSKFRVSKKGRLAYDIIRTILATCQANGVDARKYLIHILKNQIDARQNPHNYTPIAYIQQQK